MAIIKTLNTNQITNALYADKENNGFSYEACEALVEYLEQLSEELDENIELDVVALRCEWSEQPYAEIANDYDIPSETEEGFADEDEVLSYLQENTTAIKLKNTILFMEF